MSKGFGIVRGSSMKQCILALFVLASLAAGKDTIATVTGGKSVKINGAEIAAQGVPSLPLVSGDEVSTAAEPAVITLTDGSSFTLDRNSTAKVTNCGATTVEILQGTATYRFSAGSSAQLCALGHPVTAAAMAQGSVTIESPDKAVLKTADAKTVNLPQGQCQCTVKSASHRRTTLLIVISSAAAAAAVALGLALTLPGSVSASTPGS